MSEQLIAVVVSLRCEDCTPEEAVRDFREFLSESGITPGGIDGSVEVLDVTLLFPRRACE